MDIPSRLPNPDVIAMPELSQSQTTLEEPLSPGLKKSKSQRTRPTDQQYVAPPAPLKTPVRQPELRPKVSKTMSLFSLFSKPKVEKLRGYAEQGLDVPAAPQRTLSTTETSGPKQNVAVQVQHLELDPQNQGRPTTSRSYSARAARLMSREPTLPTPSNAPNDRKARAVDLPPLFQVWPQTIKHGVFEVPLMDTVLQKPKSRTTATLFVPDGEIPSLNVPGNRSSIESKMTVKTTLRHARSSSNLALSSPPQKLFVLTTSGYLCQYAAEGNNERLPERILRLGKDSAAYASDLVAGKHHVLRVAHAVDQHGVVVGESQSILSRFGMRSQPKRIAPSLLIVMPNAEEMGTWMRAIREEIEVQGGKRLRSEESISRPTTGKPTNDLKKSPSQSHRYQIKRDPHGPSNVSSPTLETLPTPLADGREQQDDQSPPQPSEEASLGDGQQVLVQKEEGEASPTSRPRAPSDTPSISSSTALSVDQQQLDKLRNSARMSHTSTVATSVMTAASCANSLASSPTDQFGDSSAAAKDSKSSYRTPSSATLAKRRSAAPLSLRDAQRPDAASLLPTPQSAFQDMIHSPVVGYASPIPEPAPSPKNQRLATAQSVPNLKTIAEPGSSLPFPMSTPAEERPESFLADLPDPTTWANKHSPNHRGSVLQPLPEAQATTDLSQTKSKSRTSVTSRPLRNSSNSFSVPLRVNPSGSTSPQSPQTPRTPGRPSSGEQDVASPIPAITTLEAKVDIIKRTNIDIALIPPRKSSNSGSPPRDGQSKSNCSRLSLFPTAKPLPPTPSIVPIKGMRTRSPSAASVTTSTPSPMMPNVTRLARPASLQVRSDRAPFLSSMRSADGSARSVTTAPIRGLKPSRSAGNMIARSATAPTAGHFNFAIAKPAPDSEAADKITPLVDSLHSPLILGSVAHQSSRSRKSPRVRSSLPDMDLAALGPPAPPPSAPLPSIPDTPQSPMNKGRLSIIRTGTPIGMAIGDALHNVGGQSPTKPPLTMGLGIQVGGGDS